ncbi:hypothetical protein NPIL_77401 [Nephila pilipes]|uniref:Uncharacterized protein n=1 Tax=Nephila pilipes TaxID=299642 RepID=A0A8X6N1T9_NEPPI|nr:hypothetical protein NPIL_77401 [Nephila pilipes]
MSIRKKVPILSYVPPSEANGPIQVLQLCISTSTRVTCARRVIRGLRSPRVEKRIEWGSVKLSASHWWCCAHVIREGKTLSKGWGKAERSVPICWEAIKDYRFAHSTSEFSYDERHSIQYCTSAGLRGRLGKREDLYDELSDLPCDCDDEREYTHTSKTGAPILNETDNDMTPESEEDENTDSESEIDMSDVRGDIDSPPRLESFEENPG